MFYRTEAQKAAEFIFPELKEESKSERIRKAILTGLIDCRDAPDLGWSDFGGIEIDDCIAWLEKQTEQKPADWSEEDELMLDEIIDFFENGTVKLQHDLSLYAHWLKSLRHRKM